MKLILIFIQFFLAFFIIANDVTPNQKRLLSLVSDDADYIQYLNAEPLKKAGIFDEYIKKFYTAEQLKISNQIAELINVMKFKITKDENGAMRSLSFEISLTAGVIRDITQNSLIDELCNSFKDFYKERNTPCEITQKKFSDNLHGYLFNISKNDKNVFIGQFDKKYFFISLNISSFKDSATPELEQDLKRILKAKTSLPEITNYIDMSSGVVNSEVCRPPMPVSLFKQDMQHILPDRLPISFFVNTHKVENGRLFEITTLIFKDDISAKTGLKLLESALSTTPPDSTEYGKIKSSHNKRSVTFKAEIKLAPQ